MDKYIVLVLEEFCMDGQIVDVDKEYFLHRLNSDSIDVNDYDKRDFFGNFSLGVFKGNSKEKVLKEVAKKYEMEKEMLKAYLLA